MPIVVDATFTALPTGVLGSAGPDQPVRELHRRAADRHLVPDRPWPTRCHGSDIDPTHADISATFSSSSSPVHGFYFGTDGNTGGKVDFESVVLHELGHGLGFLGSMDVSGGLGSCGCGGTPFVYDRWVTSNGSRSCPSPTTPPRSRAALQGQDLRFTGAAAMAANAGAGTQAVLPLGLAVG